MVRRGRNEGSITKRSDGRWEARLTLPNGKRQSFYGQTRQKANARLTQAQHDLAKGLPVAPERQTVAQYLEQWLAGMKMEVEPASHRRYAIEVERMLPHIGHHKLTQLHDQHVTRLYLDLIEKDHLAPSTVTLAHKVLVHALADAMRSSLVQRNVATLAKKPKINAREMSPLSEAHANAFLASIAGHRFEALYVLALTTGMREGELLALHWRDILLDQKLLRVVWNVKARPDAQGHKTYYLGDTKTDQPRSIHLSDLALDALRAHKTRQKAERFGAGAPMPGDDDLLFSTPFGELYKPPALYMQFQALLKRAKLPRVRFHDLRHTCATILLSRGIPVKQVSEMLGHSDIAITLRIYGHVLPIMHEAAASMMDLVFKRA